MTTNVISVIVNAAFCGLSFMKQRRRRGSSIFDIAVVAIGRYYGFVLNGDDDDDDDGDGSQLHLL